MIAEIIIVERCDTFASMMIQLISYYCILQLIVDFILLLNRIEVNIHVLIV